MPLGATCKYFGVVAHLSGGEGLSCKVSDPITDLVVMRHDEAKFLTLQGV